MKKITTLFLFAFLFHFSNKISAQPNLNWVQKIDGTTAGSSVYDTWTYYMHAGPTIKADSRGHVVVAGTLMGTPTNFQGIGTPFMINPIAGNDCYLASYKSDGSIDWGFSLGSSLFDAPMGMNVDRNDNIYLWGFFEAPITLDPGVGSVVLTPADGNRDMFVAKYDKNGNLVKYIQLVYLWNGTMGEFIYNICVDIDGNILIGGIYFNSIDLDPSGSVYTIPFSGSGNQKLFVAKYDANFVFQNAWTLKSTTNSYPINLLDFKLASDNGFFIAGEFRDTVDFDFGPGILKKYSPSSCGFVARYDSVGGLKWVTKINNGSTSQIHQIQVTEIDNVIVAGKFFGNTTSFDMQGGGTTVFSGWTGSYGDYDLFMAAFNDTGQTIWAKHLPQGLYHGLFNSLAYQPSDHTLFASFSFTDNVNLDYGASNFTLTAPTFPVMTMGLGIFNEVNGNFIGGYKLPSSGINYNFLDARDESLYMFGYSRNTMDIDFTPSIRNITTSNNPGVFVSKYCGTPLNVSVNATDTVYACMGASLNFTASGGNNYDWYDAPTGGSLISSNDTLSITASVSQTIYVEGLRGTCRSSRDKFYLNVSVCTGFKPLLLIDENLHLQTNSVNDMVTIVGTSKETAAYELYSMDGKMLCKGLAKNNSTISMKDFSQGIYILRLGKNTFKILKN